MTAVIVNIGEPLIMNQIQDMRKESATLQAMSQLILALLIVNIRL